MRVLAVVWVVMGLIPECGQAQESVCLKSGFCLEAASHMISDGMLVVQSGSGTVQFPVDQIDGITALPIIKTQPPEPIPGQGSKSVDLLIQAALREGLEPEFVRSVAMIESGLEQNVVSPKGAIGLMQLMPKTAGELGVDPWRKEQNAMGGAAFLRQLLIRYNGNSALALAAYNAGPGAVDKYKGIPPFPETRRYVVKVLAEYDRQLHVQSEKNLQAQKTGAGHSSLRANAEKPNADHVPVQ